MISYPYSLRCIGCRELYDPNQVLYTCSACGDLLEVEYDYSRVSLDLEKMWRQRSISVWRYRELIPVGNDAEIISLGEGGTPLNLCRNLADMLGLHEVYVKNEGCNPTGSFKDRGMTVGVSKAVELNMHKVACASTGNTSSSLAAYASKARLECIVLIPSGKVAFGKLIQAIIYGARILKIRGNFDESLKIIRDLCSKYPIYLLNSLNPYRLEGQKTISYEIMDQMEKEVPDKIIVPVGNAGNISAIWKGFRDLQRLDLIDDLPSLIGIQAEGAAPIAKSLMKGLNEVSFVKNPETLATAIRIGAPVNWKKAVAAVKESAGFVETVSDQEIVEAQSLLARQEGIFVEPASAASVAGLIKLAAYDRIGKDENIVCIATGHGLKDPEIVLENFPEPIEIDAKLESLEQVLQLKKRILEEISPILHC